MVDYHGHLKRKDMKIFKIKITSSLILWNPEKGVSEECEGKEFFSFESLTGKALFTSTGVIGKYSNHYMNLDDKYEIIQEFDLEEISNQTSNNDDNVSTTERSAPLMSTSTLQGLLGNNLSKLTVEYK